MADAKAKPKRGADTTRTPRQVKYLDRLAENQGKRLVVDLDATGRANLEELLAAAAPGATQKDVVHQALAEASDRLQRKKKA